MRRRVDLSDSTDFETWRTLARGLLIDAVVPSDVDWSQEATPDLLGQSVAAPALQGAPQSGQLRVPREYVEQASVAFLHRDPSRFALLYRILWRLTHDEPRLLQTAVDADVVLLSALGKAVRRDMHKMKAFVRFREVPLERAALTDGSAAPWFVAWFEPEHHIAAAVAPFFVRRFTNMHWSIVTPETSIHWDGTALRIAEGGCRDDVPGDDASEDLWRTYYASIFNPARLKLAAMQNEMPKKYWKNLPEAPLIAALGHHAQARTDAMIAAPGTMARARPMPIPEETSRDSDLSPAFDTVPVTLEQLRSKARDCRACELWQSATQIVFGEGNSKADVMLVGEQPGDQEDLAGRPFVGPAGQLLTRALEAAGVSRESLYITNAVKHFKFVVRGKRRLHQSPKVIEVKACSTWLDHEMDLVRPSLIVALGATAAQALLKRATPVKASRGQIRPFGQSQLLLTVHPSYLLRLTDATVRAEQEKMFISDLKLIAAHLESIRST